MNRDLARYRSTLLTAMGLTPAMATLALAGCDAQADGLSQGELAQAPGPLAIPQLIAPDPVYTGQFNSFTVTGLAPFQPVGLAVGTALGSGPCPTPAGPVCLDLVGAVPLAFQTADANGTLTFTVLVPGMIEDGRTFYVQAAAYGTSPTISAAVEITTDHLPRSCGELPFPTPENAYNHFEYLICGPIPASGACAPYTDIDSFTLTRAFEYYTDQQDQEWSLQDASDALCLEDSILDACCYAAEIYTVAIGRPFTVRGDVRVATPAQVASWTTAFPLDLSNLPRRVRRRIADAWTETAHGEHASVASFARFQLHLMQLGAPADLVADTTAAMADEIRHAKDAFAVASALHDAPVGPGPLDTEGASDVTDPKQILLDCVAEGCIAETIAAAQVAAAAEQCTDPRLADTLQDVAEDESRHAALAWRFVRWMLQQHPEWIGDVQKVLTSGFVLPPTQPDPDAAHLRAFGVLPKHDADALAVRVMETVVRPCAEALFAELGGPVIAEA